jgi:DMSO reductase iron-sulfur subunit
MTQMAILTDLDRCVGCHACTIACKQENSVWVGSNWTRVVRVGPTGKYPDLQMYFEPLQCQHCTDPQCVKVCPTGASYKRADGIVLIDKDKCIGCQYCTMACPYGVRYFNSDLKVVEKCTLCAQRVDQGLDPACVSMCPAKARIFGDVDNPNSEISAKIKDAGTRAYKFTDVGNHPAHSYVMKKQTWRL